MALSIRLVGGEAVRGLHRPFRDLGLALFLRLPLRVAPRSRGERPLYGLMALVDPPKRADRVPHSGGKTRQGKEDLWIARQSKRLAFREALNR